MVVMCLVWSLVEIEGIQESNDLYIVIIVEDSLNQTAMKGDKYSISFTQ